MLRRLYAVMCDDGQLHTPFDPVPKRAEAKEDARWADANCACGPHSVAVITGGSAK